MKSDGIGFALLLAAAMPAAAQYPAMAPDAAPPARKSVQPAASASDFTIDQKGVKRTTAAPASGMAIDQPGVKRTGNSSPDVDVSGKRPGSERTTAPSVGGASAADDAAAQRASKINTSKSNLRTGGVATDAADDAAAQRRINTSKSNLRTGGVPTDAADDAAAQRKINTSKSNLRTGSSATDAASTPTPPAAAPGSTSSIFK